MSHVPAGSAPGTQSYDKSRRDIGVESERSTVGNQACGLAHRPVAENWLFRGDPARHVEAQHLGHAKRRSGKTHCAVPCLVYENLHGDETKEQSQRHSQDEDQSNDHDLCHVRFRVMARLQSEMVPAHCRPPFSRHWPILKGSAASATYTVHGFIACSVPGKSRQGIGREERPCWTGGFQGYIRPKSCFRRLGGRPARPCQTRRLADIRQPEREQSGCP